LRFVVTGGAGFIGSNLSESLLTLGEVSVIDDLTTGNVSNISHLYNNENFSFLNCSVLDFNTILKATEKVDYIYHLAALPSVSRSIKDPVQTNNVNVNGTLNILEAARRNGVKKVIFASSSSVYGDTPVLPKTESMKLNPLSPYAISKLSAEYYCRIYSKIYDLPTVCLRYFNVYGPKQNPNSEYSAVIPKFITQILNGKQPIINGDGFHTRDFTYIQDVVQANINALKSNVDGFFNIAYGGQTSLNQLVKHILDITNISINVIHGLERPGDVKHSYADISKARDKLQYVPIYKIERGLEATINWYKNYYKN
jgi:UDP-glucose 4-epimerase